MQDYGSLRNIATIYAAIVSTIALCWNIFDSLRKNRGKIKLSWQYGIMQQFTNSGDPREQIPIINLTVTNLSLNKRYVQKPRIVPSRKINGLSELVIIQMDDNTVYPCALEPGAQREWNYRICDLFAGDLGKLGDSDKFWFKSTDSMGKSYKSKRLRVKAIKHWINS